MNAKQGLDRWAATALAFAILAAPLRADDNADMRAALANAAKWEAGGKHAQAAVSYEKALSLAPSVYGNNSENTGAILNNLAIQYRTLGQYAKAEPLFLRSLAIYEATRGKGHPNTGIILDDLANLYLLKGQYAKAEPLYQRCLAIREAALGKNHPDTAATLDHLAILYKAMGQYAKAEPLYRRSLTIREAALGKNHRNTAATLNNLAVLYEAMGQYAKAEPLFLQGLAICEATLGGNHPETGDALNNLAILYKAMGQYAKAEPRYLRSLAIYEATLGKDHPSTGARLNNLGALYEAMNQYAKAEPLYLRSLAIKEVRLGKNHPDTAATLNNLAILYEATGQYAKAEPLFLRSLAIRETTLGTRHPDTAQSLNNLATLYSAMGENAKAEPLYLRSLAIYEATLGKDHPTTILILGNLGGVYSAIPDWERAARYRDRARRMVREFVAAILPLLSEKEQDQFLLSQDELQFHAALSHGLVRFEHAAETDLSAAWVINGKAVAGQARAEAALLARDNRDPRAGRLARELLGVRQSLAALTMQPATAGQEADRARRIADLSVREQDLSRRVSQAVGRAVKSAWVELAEVRKAIPAAGVLIEIVRFDRKKLGAKLSLGERYAAWIIPPAGKVRIVDLGEADAIDAAVAAARKELNKSDKSIAAGEPEAEQRLRLPMQALAKLVLQPLLPHVQDAKTWVVSPDSSLWLVPWAALPLTDGSYAIETHAIQFVISGRDLVPDPYKRERKTTAPLVVADPDFDAAARAARLAGRDCPGTIGDWKVTFAFADDGTVNILDAANGSVAGEGKWSLDGNRVTIRTARAAFTGILDGAAAGGERVVRADGGGTTRDRWTLRFAAAEPGEGTRGLPGGPALGRAERLPYTASEAEALLPHLAKFSDQKPMVFTETDAVTAVVRGTKSPKVLVLSTHGFFREDHKIEHKEEGGLKADNRKPTGPLSGNPLLRCGLLLAGYNNAAKAGPGGDTGVLTGLEIVGTDLRGTQMVVLSACETGLGDVRNGEGVAGLRQAFQLAGAESVVATLWQVPDLQSAQLMVSFFEHLGQGQARDEALRAAQLEQIRKRRAKNGAAHPYFWAAYTLTGQVK